METQRLSKYLARAGVAARRKAEEIIFEGRVTVNGKVALKPEDRVSDSDDIRVDGKKIGTRERLYYFIVNKPKGYLCTSDGRTSSRRVLDLFHDVQVRLFTVGRLDRDTEGLLVVTNDGIFANRIIHPSFNVTKEYVAKTQAEITEEHLQAIRKGMVIERTYVKPLWVKKVRKGTLKIAVSEGKKREVRLLLLNAGLETLSLVRTKIGGLSLGTLPVGTYREMTDREKELILE